MKINVANFVLHISNINALILLFVCKISTIVLSASELVNAEGFWHGRFLSAFNAKV